jgi:hypothetical protein
VSFDIPEWLLLEQVNDCEQLSIFLDSEKWNNFSKGVNLDFVDTFPTRKLIVDKYTIVWINFYYTYFFNLRGRIFPGVGVMLRLHTNTVRTEHRTFPNSQNARAIIELRLQYKDFRRMTITVVTS